MSIYDFKVINIYEEEEQMSLYKDKVMLIVNTASKCGFTSQYKALEELYLKYGEEKFVVLGFPCDQFMHQEPGSNEEIRSFCELNYGVTFPLFDKVNVKGKNAHPLFTYLCNQKSDMISGTIKWNFTKFLIDSKGNVVGRFAPKVDPAELTSEIERLISEI